MNLTSEQKRKIERVARHMEDKNIAIVEDLMEIEGLIKNIPTKVKDNQDVLDKLDNLISIVEDTEQEVNITLKIV